MKTKKSYRTIEYFIFSIILAALFPAFLIICVTGTQLLVKTAHDAKLQVLDTVESLAMGQQRYIEQVSALLTSMRNLATVFYNSIDELKAYYDLIINDYPELVNITMTDDQGRVLVSSKLPKGFSLADREHIQTTLKQPGFTIGTYIKNYATGEDSIAFAEGFVSLENKKVVQTMVLNVKNYKDILPLSLLEPDAFCGIADRDGIRLFTWPEMEIFPSGNPVTAGVWQIMTKAEKPDVLVFNYADGVKRIIAYKPLYLPGNSIPYLYIVYGRPYSSFFRPITTKLIIEFAIFTGFLLLTIISARKMMKRYISRPIHEIIKQINLLESGDYSVRSRIDDKETDMRRIATALDAMAECIEERNATLEVKNASLEKLVAEKNILLREVHHRIKNNLQVILSLMDIEADRKHTIEDFIDAIRVRIISLVNVYEMVYVNGNIEAIDFTAYIEILVTFICGNVFGFPENQVTMNLDEVLIPVERALILGLVIQELFVNAIKYGVHNLDDTIAISLKRANGKYVLSISDPGKNFRLSAEAMQRGAGLILVESLTQQLHAEISWNYDQGTECIIVFT